MSDIYETIFQKHLQHLQHAFADYRVAAIDALGQIGDPRAVDPILMLLQNPDEDLFVRAHAVRTIGLFHDPRAIPLLIDIFRTPLHSDPTDEGFDTIDIQETMDYVKSMLPAGLLEILQLPATPELDLLPVDPRDALFNAARESLLTMQDAALPVVIAALQDPNPTVRTQAAITLCYVRSTDVVPVLQPLMDDPDLTVRAHLVSHLEQLCDRRTVDWLVQSATHDDSFIVRARAAYTLGFLGRSFEQERILQALNTLQHDAHPQVRTRAQEAQLNLQQWNTWTAADAQAGEPARGEIDL